MRAVANRSLAPGDSLEASTRAYWSTNGFAFERPGRYVIEVSVDWTVGGTPVSVRGELPVFVNYPASASDNEAAANLLHPDVGKWVALGGGAYHLTEAVDRLQATLASASLSAADITADAVPEIKALRGYAGILPEGGPSDADPADPKGAAGPAGRHRQVPEQPCP